MYRYNEDTLSKWSKPASETEEKKIENTISMIKKAIKNMDNDQMDFEIFVQGSYGNNTNVRIDSDVDVNIMLKNVFYLCLPDNKTVNDYGFCNSNLDYYEYKYNIVQALKNIFGEKNVILGNKSVKIRSNSYRVNADCVITMQYRNYKKYNSLNPDKYIEGIKYFSQDKNEIINYPKRHIENGIIKNNNTNYRYKKLVRIFKRIRNEMYEKHLVDKNKITSFLVECLIWNVPDKYINGYYSWNDRIKNSIIYILNSTNYNNWNEVSDELPLFDNNRKWSIEDVKYFMKHAYIYMRY